MPVRRKAKEPRALSVPALLITALWLGLWLLWPRESRIRAAATLSPSSTRFSYAPGGGAGQDAESLLFLIAGGTLSGSNAVPRVSFTNAVTTPGTFLEFAPPAGGLPESMAARRGLTGHAAEELKSYRLMWDHTRVSFRQGLGGTGLTVASEGGLKEGRFELPDVMEISRWASNRWWEVRLFVRCGETGVPREVLVEQGGEDPELNEAAVRMVYAGRCRNAGRPREGRVRLIWGEKPGP